MSDQLDHAEKVRRAQAIATSAMWPFLKQELDERIRVSRAKLNLSDINETARMVAQLERGKILAYEQVLALATPPRAPIET